jgi:hypothetical protein
MTHLAGTIFCEPAANVDVFSGTNYAFSARGRLAMYGVAADSSGPRALLGPKVDGQSRVATEISCLFRDGIHYYRNARAHMEPL